MFEITPAIAALAGGILPALAWLWFWRREDSAHPEPRRLIALAFLAGMTAVAVAIPLEKYAATFLASSVATFTAWPAIEELVKYLAARFTVLKRREDDEPIDPVIYMLAVALGFAAAENALFLLSPISGISLSQTIITGDFRFVGATLLHVLASSAIGASLAFSFYRPWRIRVRYLLAGVILSILLHGLFNFLIMNTAPEHMIRTFAL